MLCNQLYQHKYIAKHKRGSVGAIGTGDNLLRGWIVHGLNYVVLRRVQRMLSWCGEGKWTDMSAH
jgi:hypothetical protein